MKLKELKQIRVFSGPDSLLDKIKKTLSENVEIVAIIPACSKNTSFGHISSNHIVNLEMSCNQFIVIYHEE